MTPWQNIVYACLAQVPPGRVTTYAGLARAVGGSARAVGSAMRRNPRASEVPCHRVIRSDLTIGGYRGRQDREALERKRQMLAAEGVEFNPGGKLCDRSRLLLPEPSDAN